MNAFETVSQFAKMLENLDVWLEKAGEHAKKKNFDPDVLVHARLAPDQYGLDRQVQSACDSAKFSAAYLSGQKPPSHPDNEKTMTELRARVRTCITYLGSVKATELAGADEKHISPPWLKGKWVQGNDYLTQLAIPNFYFHVTMAYAILRNNGVELGKMSYLGSFPMHDPEAGSAGRGAGQSAPFRIDPAAVLFLLVT